MIYTFGEYELDTRVFELRREGTVRPVEPQVFNVLAYLVQNRDRVVSKEELLEKLWVDRFVSETTLTSRLKEARKAVGDTGEAQSVIRTQRGRGYRFVAAVVEQRDLVASATLADAPGDSSVLERAEAAVGVPGPGIGFLPDSRVQRVDFVGRHQELKQLAAILGRALSGTRQIAFVTGEGGAGKTTLVDAFLGQVSSGAEVLIGRGQCVEYRGSGEPYMPLLDAFARLCQGRNGDRLIPLLRTDAPSWMLQMPSIVAGEDVAAIRARSGSSGERMLRELGMMIDHMTAETPLVLVLEDLHWSDYATLDAMDLLARRASPARLMVIGTWRPSDVNAGRHPVFALSQELRVRGQCEVIELPLLRVDELDAYLGMRFGESSFGPRLAAILHSRTAGNALFVRNLIDSWIERGLLRRDAEERWSLGADPDELERDVPDSLQQLIESQVGELDPEQQRILAAASVVGRAFPVALVAATLPAADEDIEHACERLVRESNFIRSEGSEQWGDGALTSRFSFVHDLHVDVLYRRIPAARRARLHQQVGLALERAWEGREKQRAPEMALHFQRALDRVRGPKYLQLAAEQALERSSYREAVDHLSAALELLEDVPESDSRNAVELKIRCRLAPALVATRGWADSSVEEHYLRARELAEGNGDLALLLPTLYGLATMYEFRGEFELAERVARERVVLDEGDTRAHTLHAQQLLTCSLLHQGRFRESVRHGEEALSVFDQNETRELNPELLVLLVQAHGWISASLHFSGRADEALQHNQRALALAAESGNELARAIAYVQAAFIRFYRREPDQCHELARVGGSVAMEYRFPFHAACARILQAWTTTGGTEFAERVRELRASIRTVETIGAKMVLPLFHAIMADVLFHSGQLEPALQALDEAIAIVDRGRTFYYAPELYRMRGLVLLALGPKRKDEALGEIQRALHMAGQQECPLFALRAATALAHIDGVRWKDRLRAITETFRQGLDTVDVREARELLG